PHPKPRDDKSTPYPRYVSGMAVSPDGKRLVTVAEDGVIRLWDVASGKNLSKEQLPPSRCPVHVAWAPDGRHLVVSESLRPGGKEGNGPAVRVWELKGDELKAVATYKSKEGSPIALAWASDGKSLAHADAGGGLGVAHFPAWTKRFSWWMPNVVSTVAFSPDGPLLALRPRYGAVYLLHLPPEEPRCFSPHAPDADGPPRHHQPHIDNPPPPPT